ncbi:hypothetical protein PO909_032357 [Leuciscus waleckii]
MKMWSRPVEKGKCCTAHSDPALGRLRAFQDGSLSGTSVVPLVPLTQFVEAWKALPSLSSWLLRTIRLGYTIQFVRHPPRYRGVHFTTVLSKRAPVMRAETAVLLAKGAIEPVPPDDMKKGGGLLESGPLQASVQDAKAECIFECIRPQDWFTAIYLKDAYFHVSILPQHRPFLRFAFEGRAYQYKVLPFGLTLSPRVFTKVAEAAIVTLEKGKMAPLCVARRLPLLRSLFIFLFLLLISQNVSPLLVYDRLTLLTIGNSTDYTSPIYSFGKQSKTSPPFLASIPAYLQRQPCLLPRNNKNKNRRRGRGKRGGVRVRLRAYLDSISVCDLDYSCGGFPAEFVGYKWRRSRWLRPTADLSNSGCLFPRCRSMRLSERGCVLGNLRPLCRASQETGPCSIRMALVNTRSVTRLGPPDGTPHKGTCPVSARLLEYCQEQNSGPTEHFSEATGAYGIRSRSNAAGFASYDTASALASRPSPKIVTRSHEWHAPCDSHPSLLPNPQPVVRPFFFPGRSAPRTSVQPVAQGDWRLHPQAVQLIWDHFGAAQIDLFASPDSSHCRVFYSLTEGTLGMDAVAHSSPSEPSRTDSVKSQGGRGAGLASCPLLAQMDLVPRTDAPLDSPSLADSSQGGPPLSETGHHVAPASRPLETPCLVPERDTEVLGDLPQAVVDTITSVREPSTRHSLRSEEEPVR